MQLLQQCTAFALGCALLSLLAVGTIPKIGEQHDKE